jgi:hypothetical protein
MAKKSHAGPGEGTADPEDIYETWVENFGHKILFVSWDGNGYKESDAWLTVHEDAACNLSSWE